MGSTADPGRWTVPAFPTRADFTPKLVALIESAHHKVQTAVDLLGAGNPQPAPDFVALLQDDSLTTMKSDKSMMVTEYQTKLSSLDTVKSTLKSRDSAIGGTTHEAGSVPAQTWSSIESRVAQLVKTLDNAPSPSKGQRFLSAGAEAGLRQAVLAAVADVYSYIEAAYQAMQTHAAQVDGSSPTTDVSYPSSGAAGGGAATGMSPWTNRYPRESSSQPAFASGGDSGAPLTQPTGNVADWIRSALQILKDNGIDVSHINPADIAAIIKYESDGNPNAINRTDSNAMAGHPSKGLMQTIDSTFNAHALPGHTDIWNPVDNIVAGVRYAISRYGSLDNVPGIVQLHEGHSYVGY